jgi:hypothetical protein
MVFGAAAVLWFNLCGDTHHLEDTSMPQPQPLAKMELIRTASGRWEPASRIRDLSAVTDAEVDAAFEGIRPAEGATPAVMGLGPMKPADAPD